ncbi:hypothetical protein CMI47_15810 [Candidatus Pacearchaeota archaeon]|nr:hypothetical protein [Candidatus Pacearchaeota archaeon]
MNKFLIIILSLLFAGCAHAHPVNHINTKPVVISKAPSTINIWIKGSWAWHGHKRHWTPGHWVVRPAPVRPNVHSVWVPGHYGRHGRWIPGHYRRS